MSTAIEPQHARISIRGLELHYVDYGPPFAGAVDLVMLHGLSSAWGSWRHVAEHWSKKYRVLALDHRGHGESAWAPPDGYRTQDYVAELEEFVDALSLTRFMLVGQSMGGHHAIAYTARHPERVIAAIANDIPPSMAHIMDRPDRPQTQRDPNFKRQPITDLKTWIAKREKDEPLTPRWAHDLAARELLRKVEGGWEARHDPAAMNWKPDDLWDELRSITRPIFFIRGGRSQVVSAQMLQDMDMAVDSARSVTLEKAGHITFWDMEPEWIEIASMFLDSHTRP